MDLDDVMGGLNIWALLVTLIMMGVLAFAFFKSPDQEAVNLIPVGYRIFGLIIAGVAGYYFSDKLVNMNRD